MSCTRKKCPVFHVTLTCPLDKGETHIYTNMQGFFPRGFNIHRIFPEMQLLYGEEIVLNSVQSFTKSCLKFHGTKLTDRTFFYQFAFVAITFMVMLCTNKNIWVFDCFPVVVSKNIHIKIYIVYIYKISKNNKNLLQWGNYFSYSVTTY